MNDMYESDIPKRGKGLAIASLILGIISIPLLCCGIGAVFGIISIILAIISLATKKAGKVCAIIGLILSLISVAVTGVAIATFAPYYKGFMDFYENSDEYIEEYDETGEYPPFLEDLKEDYDIPDEQLDQIMENMKKATENKPAK